MPENPPRKAPSRKAFLCISSLGNRLGFRIDLLICINTRRHTCRLYPTVNNFNAPCNAKTNITWMQYWKITAISPCSWCYLQSSQCRVPIPAEARFFSSLECTDWLWGPSNLLFMGTGVLSQWYSSWGMKLTTHCQLVPTFRMSRVISVVPLYAFMALIGKTLPFYQRAAANTYT